MNIQLPNQVRLIIDRLEEHGYEAFAVGGCVRDALLGRIPDDWDITTSARPDQVKSLFRRTVDTGILHGTVTVLMDKEGYEVTTYRIDGDYEDNRHPKEVSFTSDLIEDLKRRDFTINAMAYNEKKGLIDAFAGADDLENKIIRCVGTAKERFREDALRILRAVRFSAQLGFQIEEETFRAAGELAPNLAYISAERIQVELVKLLMSPNPGTLLDAYRAGITRVILPEFDTMMHTPQNNPHHYLNVGEHTTKALECIEPDKVLRLSALFHDMGKPCTKSTDEQGIDHFLTHEKAGSKMATKILRKLKFDNDTISQVTKLVLHHELHPAVTQRSIRHAMYRTGTLLFPNLLKLQKADILAQSNYKQQEKLENLEATEAIYHAIMEQNQCLSLKDLAVTGTDLIQAGIKPGKEMGELLNLMLKEVLDNPEHNNKEFLLTFLGSIPGFRFPPVHL